MKTVVYHDLEKAAPDIEIHGVAFHDGDAVDVEDSVADSLRGNRFFSVDGEDVKTEQVNAGGDINKMNVSELRTEAEARGIDHEGLSKPEIREAIQEHEDAK